MRTIPVRATHPRDRDRVIETLVLGFADDPAARWMYPDPVAYFEHFPEFADAFGGRAFESGMVHEAGDFRGAALWLPPGVYPDDDRVVELISRSVPEKRQQTLFSVFEQMGQYHPAEPHWHLPMIGVTPSMQGRGYGSALLHHALTRCDREGLPAYLESSNERNIPLYQRYGFEVLGVIRAGSCPPITPMIRQPR